MNARKIREDLGRAKACCSRHDTERALFLTITALKELGGQSAPLDLRGDFRTAFAELAADPDLKAAGVPALAYAPGTEKDVLQQLSQVYRTLKGQEKEEEYQTALQRKLNLDHCFSDGKKFLSAGKPTEADACFVEALKHYKDEKAIFGMMARAMMDAGEYVRAMGHARNGLKELPNDAELTRIIEECARLRQ